MNLKTLFKYVLNKKMLFSFAAVFLFFFLQDLICLLLSKFIFVSSEFSNPLLDLLIITASLLISFYFFYLSFVKEYRPSFSEKIFASIILFGSLYFYVNKDKFVWEYHRDSFLDIEYVWYLLFPILLFLLIVSFFDLLRFREKYFPLKKKKRPANIIFSDDPIYSVDQDKLEYGPIVRRLTEILINEKHEKSISIGLVGPWGNGKSSILNLVQEELKKSDKKWEDIITIQFMPYLNHKEDDIINEFFISLSAALSEYSGRLSNQMLIYTQKLTGLYKDNNLIGFFDKHITKIESKAAKQFYEEINCLIGDLNKKIIVFVDDLDRLNDKEILEVLKLIRNTADFKNTIFVVSMDKDYVVSRLKSSDQILSTRFIDKFFQFEVYLPEIDNSILRQHFIDLMGKAGFGANAEFFIRLKEAVANPHNLFDNYIKNFRDVKRIVNQTIYDLPRIEDDINLKDFLNFTYFKLKFPNFLKLLNENRLDYLEIDTIEGVFKLKSTKELGNEEKTVEEVYQKVIYFGNIRTNDIEHLQKYDLFKKLVGQNECLKDALNLDCEDAVLLLNTLAHLFGEENEVIDYTSIRKENNFRMLIQQRTFETVMREIEFQNLLKEESLKGKKDIISNFHSQGKIPQLINRFDYFHSDNLIFLNKAIIILILLYENRDEYSIIDSEILKHIHFAVKKKAEIDEDENAKSIAWLKRSIFEGDILSPKNKIGLLSSVWILKDQYNLWGLSENYITGSATKYFSQYLKEVPEKLWAVNDPTFYQVYYSIKNIKIIEARINEEVKSFWRERPIELLCAQSTEFISSSTTSFKISDGVIEIYGSKEGFHNFVKEHKDKNKKEVAEFLQLYHLMAICKYTLPIIFTFQKSTLMLEKINLLINSQENKDYEGFKNWVQVFFETETEKLIDQIFSYRLGAGTISEDEEDNVIKDFENSNLSVLQFQKFEYNNKHYLLLSYNQKEKDKTESRVLKAFARIAQLDYNPSDKDVINNGWRIKLGLKIIFEESIFLEVISLEPKTNTKQNFDIF